MSKRSNNATIQEEPKLKISLEEAKSKLDVQIKKGQELLSRNIGTQDELALLKNDKTTWNEYNMALLTQIFTNDKVANSYNNGSPSIYFGDPGFYALKEGVIDGVKSSIRSLESISNRIGLYDTLVGAALPTQRQNAPTNSRKVFVVHGHDEILKNEVARTLSRLELEPIILHEQSDQGMSIIQKFEQHSKEASFAVVLLTPDDFGESKSNYENAKKIGADVDWKERARQNVIFELGFFRSALGGKRVFCLRKGNTEILSDYLGVLYTLADQEGAWKYKMAKEISAAGIEVDLNKI